MNLRINNILLFISLFPVWYIKFEIFKIDILIFFSVLALIYFIIFYLMRFLKLRSQYTYYLLIAGIIFFGLDNHLSLHREVTNSVSFFANFEEYILEVLY